MKLKPALLLAVVLALFSPELLPPARAVDGAPAFVDYQGTVFDSAGKPLGSTGTAPNFTAAPQNYTMQFKIYDAQSAGNLVWAETQTVTVSLGTFSVRLGLGATIAGLNPLPTQTSIANAFATRDRYLELTVIIPPATTGTPISPRLAFLASPYAISASSAAVADRAIVADSVNQNAGNSSLFTASVTNLTVTGTSRVNATGAIEFGAGVAGKDSAAGKIGYRTFSGDSLDIVGAGTTGLNRLIKMYAEGGTTFTGPVRVNGLVAARGVPATDGYIDMQPGTSANAGYIEWFKSGATPARMAYMGYNNTNLTLVPENGANFTVSGNTVISGSLSSNSLSTGPITSNGVSVSGLPVPVAEENLRMIRGRVSATGTVLLGAGFTATRLNTGYYRISLNNGFPSDFVVTVTGNFMGPATAPGAPIIASIDKTYGSGFDVDLFFNGARTNQAFDFIAMGPR